MAAPESVKPDRRAALAATMLVAVSLSYSPPAASAHFILVAPDSWMSQDSLGSPEKLGPCGDEGGGTATGKVTSYRPGQTIPVVIDEVVHHPGHYRVALSVNDRSELPPEPVVTPAPGDPCASAAIEDPAVFPVLADNQLAHTATFTGPQTFLVTLPTNVTCSKCTLQVLEFMSSHGAPCFYHHCADLSIQGTPVACGDGQLDAGEECDDANLVNGDGCDSTCRSECGRSTQATLVVGKPGSPSGDETVNLKGLLTLPAPVVPALDPVANGLHLSIDGSSGSILDVALPGGAAWTANGAGNKWIYRNATPSTSGGVSRAILVDESDVAPGLVKVAVRAKAASASIAAADLPVVVRVAVSPTGGQCGDSSFANCSFSASGSKLKCE